MDDRVPTLRITLLPKDTNGHGSIFGGIILSHIDLAGSVAARHSCGPHQFVTVAMDKVVFHQPVYVGDLVSLYAETTRVGQTSVTTKVVVEAVPRDTEETVRVTEAEVVYVAIGPDGRPVPVKKIR